MVNVETCSSLMSFFLLAKKHPGATLIRELPAPCPLPLRLITPIMVSQLIPFRRLSFILHELTDAAFLMMTVCTRIKQMLSGVDARQSSTSPTDIDLNTALREYQTKASEIRAAFRASYAVSFFSLLRVIPMVFFLSCFG
jgi:hypothetical protein